MDGSCLLSFGTIAHGWSQILTKLGAHIGRPVKWIEMDAKFSQWFLTARQGTTLKIDPASPPRSPSRGASRLGEADTTWRFGGEAWSTTGFVGFAKAARRIPWSFPLWILMKTSRPPPGQPAKLGHWGGCQLQLTSNCMINFNCTWQARQWGRKVGRGLELGQVTSLIFPKISLSAQATPTRNSDYIRSCSKVQAMWGFWLQMYTVTWCIIHGSNLLPKEFLNSTRWWIVRCEKKIKSVVALKGQLHCSCMAKKNSAAIIATCWSNHLRCWRWHDEQRRASVGVSVLHSGKRVVAKAHGFFTLQNWSCPSHAGVFHRESPETEAAAVLKVWILAKGLEWGPADRGTNSRN